MGPGHGGPGEAYAIARQWGWLSMLQWGRATEGPESHWRRHLQQI